MRIILINDFSNVHGDNQMRVDYLAPGPGVRESASASKPYYAVDGANISLLHVSAGLLIERYLTERDPCVAVWLSRQFRLISDNPAMPDAELKVLYRTLAARWHQIATQSLLETHPGNPWLDEFPEEALA
jgi:hypothetical protein